MKISIKTFIKRLAMLLIVVLSTETVMADTIVNSGNSYEIMKAIFLILNIVSLQLKQLLKELKLMMKLLHQAVLLSIY